MCEDAICNDVPSSAVMVDRNEGAVSTGSRISSISTDSGASSPAQSGRVCWLAARGEFGNGFTA